MTLRTRIDRLLGPAELSVRDLSDAELNARIIELSRRLLNDPDLPDVVMTDILAKIADLEVGGKGYDAEGIARDGRIIAYLKADLAINNAKY